MTNRKDKAEEKRARNFIESFNALSLAAQHERSRTAPIPDDVAPSHHFPVPSVQWPPHNNPAGMPPPPILYSRNGAPLQSSLTMRHAIAESLRYNAPTTPPRVPVHRPAAGPSQTPTGLYANTPAPRPVSEPLISPPPRPSSRGDHSRTPQPLKLQAPRVHRRAQSEPLSPIPSDSATAAKGSKQCSGITAAGRQCRNQAKVSEAQALSGGDAFCHVHDKKMSEVTGFYDRKTGQTFVKFEGECA